MLNLVLFMLMFFTLVGCSESSTPAEAPTSTGSVVVAKQPDGSGLYPPVLAENTEVRLILWVAAEKRQCMAVGPTECLQIRHNPNEDWQLLYGDILGFDYQPGQVYQIEVSEISIPEPPADAPDRQWVLRQIISSHAE
ncbi:DUF4377 domain-containing protein [Rheinheimera sediminis]|uniref:DUF4377 domain-containing protein n=1 Tax=Rheinheimera sp. YQF-1 TaxID=2499626 RepID=UPI001645EE17|nr:DUF4377 domain-containing protein [Rheinheimera sp. YQF-1]